MEEPLHENWVLMARVLGGEATSSEVQKLQALLAEDAHLSQQYELLARLWTEERNNKNDLPEESTDEEIQRIIKIAEQKFDTENIKKQPWGFSFTKIAVATLSVIACITLVFFGYKKLEPNSISAKNVVIQVLQSKNGSRSRNILPDGSVVWLNAGSSLTLSPGFKFKDRKVSLEGEGFFEVVKNPYPFIVHTSGLDIKVVGTTFNVKSYPTDKTVEATLFHGIIKLSRHGDKATEFTLKPREKFVISRQDLQVATEQKKPLLEKGIVTFIEENPGRPLDENAWVFNRLEFRGDDFETLAGKLNRWYDVKIEFTDNEVKTLKFNGSFEKETIEDALKYLQIVNPFSYKINDHEILIGSY